MPNQALEQTRDSVLRHGESLGCELLNFFVLQIRGVDMAGRRRIAPKLAARIRGVLLPHRPFRLFLAVTSLFALGLVGVLGSMRLRTLETRPAYAADVEKALAWLRAREPNDGSWTFKSNDLEMEHRARGLFPLSVLPYLGPRETTHAEQPDAMDSR
jgi:hypothetical protein